MNFDSIFLANLWREDTCRLEKNENQCWLAVAGGFRIPPIFFELRTSGGAFAISNDCAGRSPYIELVPRFSESRREELEKRSLLSVNEHFSATSNAESGNSEQTLDMCTELNLAGGTPSISLDGVTLSCLKSAGFDVPSVLSDESTLTCDCGADPAVQPIGYCSYPTISPEPDEPAPTPAPPAPDAP